MLGAWYGEETIELADWGTAVLYSTQPRKKEKQLQHTDHQDFAAVTLSPDWLVAEKVCTVLLCTYKL